MDWKVLLFDLDYDERERAAVNAVLDSKWLTMGDRTAEFEERFAEFTGANHAIACANGTAALHLSLIAAGVGPGDEVILPDITFVATANAVVYTGATPVLADVIGPHDISIDPEDVRRKITPATKAIMPVHYAGYPAHMDELTAIALEHGLEIVEDCAHAPGTFYAGRHVGRFGIAAAFSFFSNKNLATGEGGMVITDDDQIAEHLRRVRSHGLTAATIDRHKGHVWGYDVVDLGYNYRISEIEAALGIVQLEKLPANNALRAEHARLYADLLADVAGLEVAYADFPQGWPAGSTSSYHIEVVVLPEGVLQADVAASLRDAGIQTSVHYRPIQTFSSEHVKRMRAEGLETSKALAGRLLTLPLYPGMGAEAVEYVCRTLREVLGV